MTERDVHFGFRLMGKEVVVSRNPFFISFLCCGSEAVKCTVIEILLNRSKRVSKGRVRSCVSSPFSDALQF